MDYKCLGCCETLKTENAWMEDGCPCNSHAGCNDNNIGRWRLLHDLQQREHHRIAELTRQLAESVAACEAAKQAVINAAKVGLDMQDRFDAAVGQLAKMVGFDLPDDEPAFGWVEDVVSAVGERLLKNDAAIKMLLRRICELERDPEAERKSMEDYAAGRYKTSEQLKEEIRKRLEPRVGDCLDDKVSDAMANQPDRKD